VGTRLRDYLEPTGLCAADNVDRRTCARLERVARTQTECGRFHVRVAVDGARKNPQVPGIDALGTVQPGGDAGNAPAIDADVCPDESVTRPNPSAGNHCLMMSVDSSHVHSILAGRNLPRLSFSCAQRSL